MPDLRKNRILNFVLSSRHQRPPLQNAGDVVPAICIKAYSPMSGAFSVITPDGAMYEPSVTVTEEPTRGCAFWPRLNEATDVDFVEAPLTPPEPIGDEAETVDASELTPLGSEGESPNTTSETSTTSTATPESTSALSQDNSSGVAASSESSDSPVDDRPEPIGAVAETPPS